MFGRKVCIRGKQGDTYSSDDSENYETVVDPPSKVSMFYFDEYFETDNPMIFLKREQTKKPTNQEEKKSGQGSK